MKLITEQMKVGAIVQARTSSIRLPSKILKELPYGSGITVLGQIIRRLNKSQKLDEIIIATTNNARDDEIVKVAKRRNTKWFRGSNEDVLSRYYLAAKENNIDVIVRITSDCPCIDPEIVDKVINEHIAIMADYTSKCHFTKCHLPSSSIKTFPSGLDVEVFNFDALEKTYREAKEDYEREHVTPYIYRNPHVFKINQLASKEIGTLNISLNTEKDYILLCTIFDYLYPQNEYFNAYDIVNLFKEKPWLKLINRGKL